MNVLQNSASPSAAWFNDCIRRRDQANERMLHHRVVNIQQFWIPKFLESWTAFIFCDQVGGGVELEQRMKE